MNVLYLTDPEPDYLADQIYDGLCARLGWQQVFDFPGKAIYHDPTRRSPALTQNPGHGLERSRVLGMLHERRIDLLIVSSPRRGAVEAFNRLAGIAALPPVILLDGEDDGDIRVDLANGLGAGLYFKRELKSVLPSRAKSKYRKTRGGTLPLQGRMFPLPFSVTAGLLQWGAEDARDRDIDISFVGRASHRKRVQAVKLLRGAQDISFEGRLYLDASDRRSKLAGSRLGILTAKLMGDPPATADMQVKLDPHQYRALLRRSKMGLAIRGGGFDTVRYWEIVAMRALLVSEPPDIEIPHNFEHGRHAMFCREDLRDLLDIVRRLRVEDARRHDMVEAAYEHLLAFHTSEGRAAYLLDLCRAKL